MANTMIIDDIVEHFTYIGPNFGSEYVLNGSWNNFDFTTEMHRDDTGHVLAKPNAAGSNSVSHRDGAECFLLRQTGWTVGAPL